MRPRIALTYADSLRRVIEIAIERELVDAVEIVPSGYLAAGNARLLRERLAHFGVPHSFHFIEGSLASADFEAGPLTEAMADLIAEIPPFQVSDHLTCCRVGDVDLEMNLPILMNADSLAICVENVQTLRRALGERCPLLLEHVPRYFEFRGSTIPAHEFLAEVAERSDCGILLDLHNLLCDERNVGLDAEAFIRALPAGRIREIHLAGGRALPGDSTWIDGHDGEVPARVFELLDVALAHAEPALIVLEREHRFHDFDRILADLEQVRDRVSA